MLRITTIIALFLSQIAFTQDYTSVLFDGFKPADQFEILSSSQLTDLCKKHPKAFCQVLSTNGSENKKDWSYVREYILKYPDIVEPIAYQLDVNGDGILDLIIAFQAGYEYAFVGFYDGADDAYTCIHEARGVFFGQSADDLVYVNPACCDDPTHEFYVLGLNEESILKPLTSFSVSAAFGEFFPTKAEINTTSEFQTHTMDLPIVGNSGAIVAILPPGESFRILKKVQAEGLDLWFVELNWKGNKTLLPRSFCWLLADSLK